MIKINENTQTDKGGERNDFIFSQEIVLPNGSFQTFTWLTVGRQSYFRVA